MAAIVNGRVGLRDFARGPRLGQGEVGRVLRVCGRGAALRGDFAMKVLDKRVMELRSKVARAQGERDVLAALDHPLIVKLFYAFETQTKLCLVLECCPHGTLLDLIRGQPGSQMSEASARFYVAELVVALEYLHASGVIYRDLKPENVLVRETGHICLSDFDLAFFARDASFAEPPEVVATLSKKWGPFHRLRALRRRPRSGSQSTKRNGKNIVADPGSARKGKADRDGRNSNKALSGLSCVKTESFVGTDPYMAPEVIIGAGYAAEVDWWSLGILMYEMLLFPKLPFAGEDRIDTFAQIADPNTKLQLDRSLRLSKACASLLHALLEKNPQVRLCTAPAIKKHKYFKAVHWPLLLEQTPPHVPPVHGSAAGSAVFEPQPAEQSERDWFGDEEFEVDIPEAGSGADPDGAEALAEHHPPRPYPKFYFARAGSVHGWRKAPLR